MSDIEELQSRIAAAMDRAAAGLEALSAGANAEANDVQAALDEERTVSAQLQDRLTTLKDRQAQELAALQAQMQDTRLKAEALDLEVQRLRKANDQLRDSNAALREANEAGVAEPHLINKAMLAELKGLRAARATDVAEASAILSALAPLLTSDTAPEESQDA